MTNSQTAILGGGCFWCTEAVFANVKGIVEVLPGYAGGETINPTHDDVCTGTTGHAEVVKITFDPEQITFEDILEIFFATHDPTTLNRQGRDVGTQYRSAIFVMNSEQRTVAERLIDKLNAEQLFPAPIVTSLEAYSIFYEAEDYHHNYYAKNPNAGYCQAVINPKLTKLRQKFASKLRPSSE
jgi:peptide-methionine (S)-S-oxide reductase